MTPTIAASGLSRRYRDQIALEDVSLTVEPGSVTGLLGGGRRGRIGRSGDAAPGHRLIVRDQFAARPGSVTPSS